MEAYLECRRHKRNSMAALAFEIDLEQNLLQLYREITDGTYRISPSLTFVVEKPVKREVFAADFRDRIVHHLLIKRLKPYFEREFIYDSYACREGKGTLMGVKRVRRFIAQCSKGYTEDCYILKCDISGFFMNIDRTILWRMLEQFICSKEMADKELILRLTEQIVMHNPTVDCHINGSIERWNGLPNDKSLFGTNGQPMPNKKTRQLEFDFAEPKGLPIGNLTSQWFGNFYLNRLDHYVKHQLGIRYYGRYVDDFVIIHPDREYLKGVIPLIEKFLSEQLKLKLHPKKRYLQHFSKGLTFLGVYSKFGALMTGTRTKAGAYQIISRWSSVCNKRLMTSDELKQFRDSINSYWGLMRNHSSYKLRRRMAHKFSAQIDNRTSYKGYCKITLEDYSIVGNRVVPYFEFDKLKKR